MQQSAISAIVAQAVCNSIAKVTLDVINGEFGEVKFLARADDVSSSKEQCKGVFKLGKAMLQAITEDTDALSDKYHQYIVAALNSPLCMAQLMNLFILCDQLTSAPSCSHIRAALGRRFEYYLVVNLANSIISTIE